MSILALNAGSSSLKFELFDGDGLEPWVAGEIDWPDGDRRQAQLTIERRGAQRERRQVSVPDNAVAAQCAIETVLKARPANVGPINAVGHRVVHGGVEFRSSVCVDARVKAAIGKLDELAPLHNPLALRVIEGAEAALPATPQAAVFDTTFYADLPPKAYMYPVPHEWYSRWGIRRFGFHGISQAWCARRAEEMLGAQSGTLRLISCHLGNGCSAAAIRGGKAVATTMGFTPLEGLMMGTRQA
jgi:acetate kinase